MKHKPVRINNLFEIKEGKVIRKNRYCPRCGTGVFLAKHKNRLTCGKCGYTEIFKNEA